MKSLLHGMLILPFILMLFGCGVQVKYTDREDFKKENEKERKELYKDVLSSVGVDTADKFSLMYIDYIMTESDRFKTLEKLNPTDNFSEFFLETIPLLYYSYSPANYKSVPKELKEKTTKYLVEQTPYPFNKGEEKYRKWFEKEMKKESWYIFPFFDKDEPEKKANGSNDFENFPILLATFAWLDDFNYADFKALDKSSQASLITMKARLNYINNGNTLDDDSRKIFDKIEKRWMKRADEFLADSKLTALEDDAPFNEVAGIAIELIINSN